MEECYFPLYPFWYWLKFQNKNAYTQVHTNKSSRNRDSWENFQLRNPTSWRWLPETHFHSLRAVGSKPSSMVLLEILWATEHACFRNLASLKKNTHRHKYLTVYLLTLMRYNLHPIKFSHFKWPVLYELLQIHTHISTTTHYTQNISINPKSSLLPLWS